VLGNLVSRIRHPFRALPARSFHHRVATDSVRFHVVAGEPSPTVLTVASYSALDPRYEPPLRLMDRATTPFPAASAFPELTALEVFGMSGLALFAMPAVGPERHAFRPGKTQSGPTLHAAGRTGP